MEGVSPGVGGLRLTRIRSYPLKGAAGFDLSEVQFDVFGVPGDRRWMLVRPNGQFISQRTHPRLALIQVAPTGGVVGPTSNESDEIGPGSEPDGAGSQSSLCFSVRAPGMGPLLLRPGGVEEETTTVRVQQDRVEAVVQEAASVWFSSYLREDCRLVFSPGRFQRAVDPEYAPGHITSFSDGYPLLLTTEESLADLNGRLTRPSSMMRFRPNLVLKGGSCWEEDTWRVLQIGEVRLELVKPCARCLVTTVDQGTGARGKEPLKTLSGFRGWKGKAYFGQNVVFSGSGSFRVGQTVRIVEKGEARPPLVGGPVAGGQGI